MAPRNPSRIPDTKNPANALRGPAARPFPVRPGGFGHRHRRYFWNHAHLIPLPA